MVLVLDLRLYSVFDLTKYANSRPQLVLGLSIYLSPKGKRCLCIAVTVLL